MIIILRLLGYKNVNNRRLQHLSVSLSFFHLTQNVHTKLTSSTFGFVAQYSGLVSEIITEKWVVHTKGHLSRLSLYQPRSQDFFPFLKKKSWERGWSYMCALSESLTPLY